MADREFQRQRMARLAWFARRCPAREKPANGRACLEAIKRFLEGVERDVRGPVGSAERRREE